MAPRTRHEIRLMELWSIYIQEIIIIGSKSCRKKGAISVERNPQSHQERRILKVAIDARFRNLLDMFT